MSKHTREELLYLAKLAEQCERYDEMGQYTTQFAKQGSQELTLEERNILSVAFKNVVGTRRAAWRVLSSIQKKENHKGNQENVAKVRNYKNQIQTELSDICQDIFQLLDEFLVPNAKSNEAKVFFSKMKADYLRYIAEFATSDQKSQYAGKALSAYNESALLAKEALSSTHPLKLGLALNHSVFHYEIMQNPSKACEMARAAFDEAIADLDSIQDEYYKDATLIMQLLRDNLLLWTSEMADDDAQG